MRSDQVKKGVERAPNRALLYSTGITRDSLNKPFIGIASSYTDIVPGHVGMRELGRDFDLAEEPLWTDSGGKLGVHDLDGDLTVMLEVVS